MTRYSDIKNKIKRQQVYHNEKIQKNKVKKREKNGNFEFDEFERKQKNC